MTIDHTALPAIGPRFTLTTEDGRHVGVVRHHDRRELVVYDVDDPDRVAVDVVLTPAEADALAALLGCQGPAVHVVSMERHRSHLASVHLLLGPGSPWAGRTVEEVNRRAGPGASVVGVARQDDTVLNPPPGLVLRQGDVALLLAPADVAFTAIGRLTQN
ncbi:cation:proton antiporter regulatory subunit [Rhizomonospora bruguierae]|uniref:cation:proton antiporter regulatory subunit n=1 Tax=Rhizomonospora bruguierae TaxID=1581705 RepID=UPI001BD0F6F3|nr:TrkA C-terminal domain-containing protein [Micromonospora sp. NBRC 107566]